MTDQSVEPDLADVAKKAESLPGPKRARLIACAIVFFHLLATAVWWYGFPHGFPRGHVKWWTNQVIPAIGCCFCTAESRPLCGIRDQTRSAEGDEKDEEEVTMTDSSRKLSAILKEMSERLLRNPDNIPTSEAAHIALMFANFAWNETVGMIHPRTACRSAWEIIEADNPDIWSELKSNDVDAMIDELAQFKKQHYPDDLRRILTCGIMDGKVHVEWLPAAAPGVDSKWEMRLYGLVRTGKRDKAIQFLLETRRMSGKEAEKRVAAVAAELGIG